MYQHLLVPLEDTELSAANVVSAVEVARCFGARITFFHARADWGCAGDGELISMLAPGQLAEVVMGETHALLSKAMACARAVGVSCEGLARPSEQPAQAIAEAALSQGCDLIVMATRGRQASGLSSWLHSSQTERVLRNSPVALLVTRVESLQPITDDERALGIIQDEHRSLAVVVHAMQGLMHQASGSGAAPEFERLERMVAYLYEFPERVHHPKEEQYLHRLLRLRDAASESMLTEVEAQHRTEGALIERVLEWLVQARASGAPSGVQGLSEAVDALARHVLHHIGHEERVVLPAARKHLLFGDWAEIADAFAANDHPQHGRLPHEEFHRLFTRIANGEAQARGA